MGVVLRPYEYCRNGLTLDLDRYKLDGKIKSISDEVQELKELDLHSRRFSKITLEFSYELDFEPSEYAPEDNPPFELLIVLHNNTTHTREVVLREEISDNGKFDIALQKEDFRGKIKFESLVVRSEQYRGKSENFATDKHKKVASGDTWNLKVDETSSSGTGLICEWKDFTSPELDQVTEEMMYYLDIDDLDEPRLLLNRKSERLTTMMNNRASTGKNARIRDVLNDVVFLPSMFQLILRSIASVDSENFEGHYVEETLFSDFSKVMDLDKEKKSNLAEIFENPEEVEDLGRMISKYLQLTNPIADDMDMMLKKVMNE